MAGTISVPKSMQRMVTVPSGRGMSRMMNNSIEAHPMDNTETYTAMGNDASRNVITPLPLGVVNQHGWLPLHLISGGWDRLMKIYDTRIGKPVAQIGGPLISGDCIDINGDEILTASNR